MRIQTDAPSVSGRDRRPEWRTVKSNRGTVVASKKKVGQRRKTKVRASVVLSGVFVQDFSVSGTKRTKGEIRNKEKRWGGGVEASRRRQR